MKYLFLLAALTITVGSAYASGGAPCCIGFHLDKTEYTPGDIVTISVMADQFYAHSNELVIIKISDVTFGPDHTQVVYKEQKSLQDGKVEFEYKSPQSSDRYRYLVTLESPLGTDSKMFFTKKDASKIIISDVKLLTPKVSQGDQLKLEARIVDGASNPLHYLRVSADSQVPQQSCPQKLAGVGASLSPLESIQPDYWSKGIISMTIPVINTATPGTYDLVLSAGGDIEGFSYSRTTVKYEILESSPKDPPYTIFAPFNFEFKPGFMTEQVIDFTSQTTYNGCGAPIPHVPIKAELKKYDIQSSQYIETIATENLVSDDNGYYHAHFEPIGVQAGYFSFILTADYPGITHGQGIESPHNTKNFTITEEGKEFVVETDTWYSIPLNVDFSKQEKKLTLDVDTSDTYRRISLKVPTSLLDGDFVIFENGVQRTDIEVSKRIKGYSAFDFKANAGKTKIEIVGTSAVPEFGSVAALILAASLISVIGIYGMRFRK